MSQGRGRAAFKISGTIDWQICASDAEWEAVLRQAAPGEDYVGPCAGSRAVRWGRPGWAGAGVLVAAVLLAGLWVWRTAQAGLATVAAEVGAAVQGQVWLETQGQDVPAVAVDLVELAAGVAVVQVETQSTATGTITRQTQVYQETAQGWVRTTPAAFYWGPPRRLETEYFVFRYYARDAEAVRAAAGQLDALYPALYAAFFPAPPHGPKTVVEVSPEQVPGRIARRDQARAPIVVPSPAILLAPVTLPESEVLAQAVVLALLDEQVAQVKRELAAAAGPHGRIWEDDTRLQDWLDGVRLWQLWAQDLPLAAWRVPVVQWVYAGDGYPTGQAGKAVSGPDPCGLSRLWLSSALQLEALLLCDGQGRVEPSSAWRQLYPPPATLASLGVLPPLGTAAGPAARFPHPAAPVALATLLEYAAAAYGLESIPALLASLREHDDWKRLVPAVFAVSAAEFEAEWNQYLVEKYGLDPDLRDEGVANGAARPAASAIR